MSSNAKHKYIFSVISVGSYEKYIPVEGLTFQLTLPADCYHQNYKPGRTYQLSVQVSQKVTFVSVDFYFFSGPSSAGPSSGM